MKEQEHNNIKGKVIQFGYVPQLDGMRGIAILAVMVFHAGLSYFPGGFIGVDIFFVLSGFLITSLLIKEYGKDKHINLKHFYLRRALRLLPALILLLLIFSVLSLCFLSWHAARSNLLDATIVLFYVANWARAFQIHGVGWLGHAWSLSIEEQFYILWPTCLIYFLRHIRSRRKIFLIILLLALLAWALRVILINDGATVVRVYNGLDTRADSLLIGCALGVFLSSGMLTPKLERTLLKLLRFAVPVAVIALVSVILWASFDGIYVYNWLLVLVEISTVVLILSIFISKSSLLKKILSNKPLVWIGSISYGLYLWHYPIFMLMFDTHLYKLVLPLGVPAAFLVATCSYYFWEKPFLKLKSKLSPTIKSSETKIQGEENITYSIEHRRN